MMPISQIHSKGQDAKILFTGDMLAKSPGKQLQTKMIEVTTASKAFADKNPDAVTKFVDVLYNRTHKYFNDPATKAQARQELADWLKATVLGQSEVRPGCREVARGCTAPD